MMFLNPKRGKPYLVSEKKENENHHNQREIFLRPLFVRYTIKGADDSEGGHITQYIFEYNNRAKQKWSTVKSRDITQTKTNHIYYLI